jgi:hypothetical protein
MGLDEELRPAIDRLIATGGRLTIEGEGADGADGVASVVLEQAGSRFGILEVRGRAVLPGVDHGAAAALEAAGWTDPRVTNRLGREVRIGPEQSAAAPIQRARTWRVPPALASEIAADVRAGIEQVARIDYEPLRGRPSTTPVSPPRAPAPHADQIDAPTAADQGPRMLARTVPAPIKGIAAIAVVALIGVAWIGMIRGSTRATSAARPSPSVVAIVEPTSVPATATPIPTPTELLVLRPERVQASTEEKSGLAGSAVDNDPFTAWHAAFGVPQWIEIVLETPATINEVFLLIAQEDPGTTRHMIQVAGPGQALRVVGLVDRQTIDGESIVFRPETPLENIVRIRIETMASPSNAGWYEVIIR